MGTIIFSDTHSSQGVASATYEVRLTYSETYYPSTKKTKVQITDVHIRKKNNTTNWPEGTMFGDIEINGTVIMSVYGGWSYTCHIDGSDWCRASIPTPEPIYISHNANTGTASMQVRLIGRNNDYFCSYVHYYSPGTDDWTLYAGVKTTPQDEPKNVSLTTHVSTLAVNPNGGLWDSSSSIQTFTKATGTTKTISNPTRSGFRFIGWSLSGGGGINGTTFTFGESNSTLVAQWEALSYTLTISGDEHSIISVTRNSVPLSNGASISYNDTLNISISAVDGYQIETRSPAENTIVVTGNLTVSATTSPRATIHIRKNGAWALYLIHKRISSQWALYQANIRKNGQWLKYF